MARIDSGATPKKRLPINVGEPPKADPKITFSFEYWRQIDWFGLSTVEKPWFVGLLDRLQVISARTRAQWEGTQSDVWHYHTIKWGIRNMPVNKNSFPWVPKQFIHDEENYGLRQFALGAGQGRVAGFWETSDRFAIVLLDPEHNLQPAEGWGFRVTRCGAELDQAGLIHREIDATRQFLKCVQDQCPVHAKLAAITVNKKVDGDRREEVVSFALTPDDLHRLEGLLAIKPGFSMREAFARAVRLIEDEWVYEQEQLAEMEKEKAMLAETETPKPSE